MKVRPVENTPAPGYPDKYAEETRKALAAARPQRWIAAPVAAGLAATMALGLSGCGDGYATAGEPTQTPLTTAAGHALGDYGMVAADAFIPLFEYGEGTGSFGCVSVAAPYFMSEDEAFALLSVTFAEAGLTLEFTNQVLQKMTLPVTDLYPMRENRRTRTTRGNLAPDAMLDGLPVAFVSMEDVRAWEKDTGMRATVESYRIKDAAQALAENNPGIVVFYDPVTYWDIANMGLEGRDWAESEDAARDASQRLLREQAEAFLQWLRTEGGR